MLENYLCALEKNMYSAAVGWNVCTCITSFIVLHFIMIYRYGSFYKLKVCGNSVSSKSLGTIFPIIFAYFVSLCHILIILPVIQTLHHQKYYDLLKSQMMVSIFEQLKYFLIKVCTLFFRHNSIAHLIDGSIV